MLFLPVNVTLEVTNQCNLSCKHCFRHSSSRMNDELSSDEIEAVLDQLLELGTVQIEVSGGEPLLHPNIFGLLEAIVGRGFETTLITNGTKLNREQCSRLRAIGVTNIQVSVDGTENDHDYLRGPGSYRLTVRGLVNLVESGLNTIINMVVTSRSLDSIREAARQAHSLGVRGFALSPFLPAGRGLRYSRELTLSSVGMRTMHKVLAELIATYESKMKIYSNPLGYLNSPLYEEMRNKQVRQCSCGRHLLFIKPNGVLSPCDFDLFSAGNVRELKIEEAWSNAPVFHTFRKFDPRDLKGICATCEMKEPCGGGCRALAVIHCGDFFGENPICPLVSAAREKLGQGTVVSDKHALPGD